MDTMAGVAYPERTQREGVRRTDVDVGVARGKRRDEVDLEAVADLDGLPQVAPRRFLPLAAVQGRRLEDRLTPRLDSGSGGLLFRLRAPDVLAGASACRLRLRRHC